ncbi:MAG: hypothetical protein ACRDYC_08060, partial [Acidimicrobiales bacterium]
DYCDQKLASFEIVLERTIRTVAAGRQKLSATPAVIVPGPGEDFFSATSSNDETLTSQELFFDQDRG